MYTFMVTLAVLVLVLRVLLRAPKPATVVCATVADAMPRAGSRRAGEYAWASVNADAKRGTL
jgi:hypothetical protein